MKLYKVSQNVNNGYDTYSDMVVCAETAEDAKRIHPSETWQKGGFYDEEKKEFWIEYVSSKKTYLFESSYGSWTNDLDKIKVEEIGEANSAQKKGVICSSFHAG